MANKKKVKYKLRIIPKERRKAVNVRSRRITPGLTVFFIVVILGCMFLKSEHFDISSIAVNGNNKLTDEEIIDASGIRTGDNLFDYNTSKARKAVMSLSYIDSCEIVRKYPDEVHINVKEKAGSMAYLTGGIYCYLDEEGYILKTESSLVDTDVMIVSFAGQTESVTYTTGDKLDLSSDPRLAIASNIHEFAVENELTHFISEYYVSESGVNYIYTTKSNVIKFYTYSAFEENKEFVKEFVLYEDRHIMAEVVEDTRPVYKVIEIE